MLAAPHRLRTAPQFTAVLRGRGSRRAASRLLVLHAAITDTHSCAKARVPRVGFIVSKAVGNAVVRNRTKRVLRHQMAQRLAALPPGADLVVRACPAAAGRDSATIGRELDRLLRKVDLEQSQ